MSLIIQKKTFVPLIVGLLTILLAFFLKLNVQQTAALLIIAFMISSSLVAWKLRLPIAFLGVAILFFLSVQSIEHFIEASGLDVIVFLLSMMLIIGYLEEQHFFDFILFKVVKLVGNDAFRITATLMIMAAISAALVDEVTAILFITSLTLYFTNRMGVNPVPFILMVIFATNIGSSATVVGNPVGVLVALKAGLSFIDFLRWMMPVSLIVMAVLIPLCFGVFKKDMGNLQEKIKIAGDKPLFENVEIKNFTQSMAFFGLIIGGLILHHPLEELLHLEKNTLLIVVAMTGAAIALFWKRENMQEFIEKRVEWKTLLFFLLLFSTVGALRYVGVVDVIAQALVELSGESRETQMFIIFIAAGIMSAVLDNIIAVALLISVVQTMEGYGVNIAPLWWLIVMAATYFGNLTPIGSTANIVAIGMMERRGFQHITFIEWIRYAFIVVLITSIIGFFLLYIQFIW